MTAQSYYLFSEKPIERVNAAREMAPLTIDGLFGDEISKNNGAAEFSNVDISIPGNNALAVELRRSLTVQDRSINRKNGNLLGGFAEWDLDIPRISATVLDLPGLRWRPGNGTVDQRCSMPGYPPHHGWFFHPSTYFDGYHLRIPGLGSQEMLGSPNSQFPTPTTDPAYPWITKNYWRISCKTNTANGYPGQAFYATSPDGTRYTLDWAVSKEHADIRPDGGDEPPVDRVVVHMLATRVQDRFGNYVDYTYSGTKLVGIASSDGRWITLAYAGDNVTSVQSSTGTWSYSYVSAPGATTGKRLQTVTLPYAPGAPVDQRQTWKYQTAGSLEFFPETGNPRHTSAPEDCPDDISLNNGSYVLTVTTPSAAKGVFSFRPMRHYRTMTPDECVNAADPWWHRRYPTFTENFTLETKQVTGPGLTPATWTYFYGYPDDGMTKHVTVSGPEGRFERYTIGAAWARNEGLLLKTERGSGPENILWSKEDQYVTNDEAYAGQAFPATVGFSYGDNYYTEEYVRPIKASIVQTQNTTFTKEVSADCNGKYCFDLFTAPTKERSFSSLASQPNSRTDTTEYHHNFPTWVLGQLKKRGNVDTGVVESEIEYWPTSHLPKNVWKFGLLHAYLEYNADGTTALVRDGNAQTTLLSNWYRGVPRFVRFPATPDSPAGATRQAAVSEAGWVTSTTDENQFTHNYSYDALGRLANITYPTGDTVAWAPTNFTFQYRNVTEHGLAPGHWLRTETTGNGTKHVYLDALFRPMLVHEFDSANYATSLSAKRFTYDSAGRKVFESYASTNPIPESTGSWTQFDSIDRLTSVSTDSELGLLTTTTFYEPGFIRRVRNPRGIDTSYSYQAFDQPSSEFPVGVTLPESAFTTIKRDIWGKPEFISRSGMYNGAVVGATRWYAYDAHQRLCKTINPESGASYFGYDNVNLTWSAEGQPYTWAAVCDSEYVGASQRTSRVYDGRNRVTSVVTPGNVANISTEYEPDGKVKLLVANQPGSDTVRNFYYYNRRRLLTQEKVQVNTLLPWQFDYAHNSNGHLSSQTYPGSFVVGYAPDALGRPTQAGSFASEVTYYPNGAIKRFKYGNQIVHNMTQNDRKGPARSFDEYGATKYLDDSYTYDQNGNVLSLIDASIAAPALNRTWGFLAPTVYDGLDRLVSARSSNQWGSPPSGGSYNAIFAYDPLNNVRSLTTGATRYDHTYDLSPGGGGSNRLLSTQLNGGSVYSLTHDSFGRMTANALKNQSYDFDISHRMTAVTGKESYLYDGHGRRARTLNSVTGTIEYFGYGADGKLLQDWSSRRGNRKGYVYLGGDLIGSYGVTTVNPNLGAITLEYFHTDALGSPAVTTDVNRNIVGRQIYTPFGSSVAAPVDGVGYTGHVMDVGTGLTYMQQRYYDPAIGRFLSPDPDPVNPVYAANFDRYGYANNNPLNNFDPDGRKCVEVKKGYSCTVDEYVRPTGSVTRDKMTVLERRSVRAFEKSYTAAVNKLMSNQSRSVTISMPAPAGASGKGASATTTAGEVGRALIARNMIANDPIAKDNTGTSGDTTYLGPLALGGIGSLKDGPKASSLEEFRQIQIVHEGMHGTGTSVSTLLRGAMAIDPWNKAHQPSFNDAAKSLLGP